MLRPVRTVAPAELPVTLAEAKAQCRVFHDDDDASLLALVRSAVARLDGRAGVLGRCLVTQTWRQDFWAWGTLRLPFPDVQSAAVTYLDADGAQQSVAADDVILRDETVGVVDFVEGWTQPTLEADNRPPVSVTFVAGYGAASAVPWEIRQAILLHVEALYDRTPEDRWRPAYQSLIAGHRLVNL